jgi:tryptophanyl-tRNA synthetase
MSIVTDPTPVEAPKDPDASTVYTLYRLVAPADKAREMAGRFLAGGYGYGDAKKELFGMLWEFFKPYRDKRALLAADPGYLAELRKKGAARVRALGMPTLEKVRTLVGVR